MGVSVACISGYGFVISQDSDIKPEMYERFNEDPYEFVEKLCKKYDLVHAVIGYEYDKELTYFLIGPKNHINVYWDFLTRIIVIPLTDRDKQKVKQACCELGLNPEEEIDHWLGAYYG